LIIEVTSHAASDKAFFEHKDTESRSHKAIIAEGKYREVNIAKLLSPQANIAVGINIVYPPKTLLSQFVFSKNAQRYKEFLV
jgi:hypothetical protein